MGNFIMNYLNIYFKQLFTLPLVLILLLSTGCEDYNDLNPEPIDTGNADFSSYVAAGNSLTAGFQNNALYETGQIYSYPKLIARQVNASEDFTQPLVSNPGLSSSGRIELVSLEPLRTSRNTNQGQPTNSNLESAFNNLGVPGAILADFTGQDLPGAPYSERRENNPFFNVVLRDKGNTQAEQLTAQSPTFISFWLGNNDVLGFVTSGGEGQPITPPSSFAQLYQGSAQALASTGANVMVYNIPDVTSIPFVFYLRTQLEQQEAITFNESTQTYQLATPNGSFDIYIDVDGTPQVMRQDDFPLLSAQSYFAEVQAGEVPPPVQPQNAIPDELVLDGNLATPNVPDSELEQAAGAVTQFNATIRDVASANGFALVNINSIFNGILQSFQTSGGANGYQPEGINLRPVPGEIFSFDGIHPTNRGSAVVANESIKVINESYNASIPLINVAKIPEGLPVASGN